MGSCDHPGPIPPNPTILRHFLVNPRSRLLVLAALTSLVPLGAGVYSLDPPASELSSDRPTSAAPFGPAAAHGPGVDALVPRLLPTGGDLFGGLWTPGSGAGESSPRNDAAARAGGSVSPGSAPDSVDRVPGDAVGALPRKTAAPDRWQAREA